MAQALLPSAQSDAKLAEFLGQFRYDPYGFVMAVFPWGKEGTSLHKRKGPEPWQEELLRALGDHLVENYHRRQAGMDMKVWRSAVASGHGVGKSALVAWINYFVMSLWRNARGVVTANTGVQLETRTWPELAKWHALAINSHWFQWTATSFYFKAYPEDKRKNYMISAQTSSPENTEGFQGLHNEESAVLVIFDEASGIEGMLWEVVEGALTDGEGFFFAFGNPTRPEGDFADCFTKHNHLYWTKHVDSREVSHTNKEQLKSIIEKYGADSDTAKVRVYGQFPVMSYDGYITAEAVTQAQDRELYPDLGAALIMAIDVARFGDDTTVLRFRQGNNARDFPKYKWRGLDGPSVAKRAAEIAQRYKPDAIVIESVGPGISVIDHMRLLGFKVHAVHPGERLGKTEVFGNLRMLWWSDMRDWLTEQGCIDDDPDLFRDLTNIRYRYDNSETKMYMEAKKDMKARSLPSPDDGDSLALTFAVKVARRDFTSLRSTLQNNVIYEYDVLHEA